MPLGRSSVLLMLAVFLFSSSSLVAQQRPRTKPHRAAARFSHPELLYRPLHLGVSLSPTGNITETEPNNTAATASTAALGDVASAAMDTTGDIDWYVINVPADTTLILDVDASQIGSSMDPFLWLIAPDSVRILASSDDVDSLDSYVEYHITTPGTYFVAIQDFYAHGGSGYFYHLKFDAKAPPPPGPGDPTTLFAQGLGGPYGVAAGSTGELYVTDLDGRRLWKVSSSAVASPLTRFTTLPLKVTWDGFGNLLVTYSDTALTSGGVYRINPAGQASPFATGLGNTGGITVGPDGDVWVLDIDRLLLFRFGPFGARKDSIDVSAINAQRFDADLAFSPGGVLYISNGYDAIYRLVNRVPQRFISAPIYVESMAFDADGYLYVANGYLGTVSLYAPDGQRVSNPFALSNLGGPTYLAFGRGQDGSMTSRLFATNYGYNLLSPYAGGIVEMRNAAMRGHGFRVGVDAPSVSLSEAVNHLLGSSQLSIEGQNYLDLQGNKNGRYDIGDFRAYLRAQGQLPAAASPAGRRQP